MKMLLGLVKDVWKEGKVLADTNPKESSNNSWLFQVLSNISLPDQIFLLNIKHTLYIE